MLARVAMLQNVLMRTAEADDPVQKPFATSKAFDAGLTDLQDRGLVGWDRETQTYDLHPVVRGVVWRGVPEAVKQRVYEALQALLAVARTVPVTAEEHTAQLSQRDAGSVYATTEEFNSDFRTSLSVAICRQ